MSSLFTFNDLLNHLQNEAEAPAMPRIWLLNGTPRVKAGLYPQGWEWMPTIYQWWITDSDRNLTIDRLIARIEEYIPFDWEGPVHLDLEHDDHLAHIHARGFPIDGPQCLDSREKYTAILTALRDTRPSCLGGNYGLGGSEKWPRGRGFWSTWTEEQQEEYAQRHIAMSEMYGAARILMTRTYDHYPQGHPDSRDWQDAVQAGWMEGTIFVARRLIATFGHAGNIHTFNDRTQDALPLTREEIWKYQILPALLVGWDVQWWGASAPLWSLYEQNDEDRRAAYARKVNWELVGAGVNPKDRAAVTDYFDKYALALGSWIANRIKAWAAGVYHYDPS